MLSGFIDCSAGVGLVGGGDLTTRWVCMWTRVCLHVCVIVRVCLCVCVYVFVRICVCVSEVGGDAHHGQFRWTQHSTVDWCFSLGLIRLCRKVVSQCTVWPGQERPSPKCLEPTDRPWTVLLAYKRQHYYFSTMIRSVLEHHLAVMKMQLTKQCNIDFNLL